MTSKTLTFVSPNALNSPVSLLLTFDTFDKSELLTDQYRVAWKVITFKKDPNSKATVEYTARVAFGIPQIDSDNLVSASAFKEMKLGDAVNLTGSGSDADFSAVRSVGGDLINCKNLTDGYQKITLGFLSAGGKDYEPALVWHSVGVKSSIAAKLNAKLKIFAASDYKATELIKGEVQTDLLWEGVVADLQKTSTFVFQLSKSTGEASLKLQNS